MANKKYTEEHIEYIRKIAQGRWNEEIRDMFNSKFNMGVTTVAISSLKANHKIKSNVPNTKKEYTQEHIDYIKKIATTRSNEEVRKMFNQKFNQNRTNRAIRSLKNKCGVTTTYKEVWEKGHVPWNKGKKGYIGANKTSFKKGGFPPNRVEISSERITKDGYIQIKIKDGEKQQNWRGKHILEWEKVNGALPPGHAIIFGDGDNRNFDIDNLICVSRKQLLGLNRNNLIQNDADLTKTAINIVNLNYKISGIQKEV